MIKPEFSGTSNNSCQKV